MLATLGWLLAGLLGGDPTPQAAPEVVAAGTETGGTARDGSAIPGALETDERRSVEEDPRPEPLASASSNTAPRLHGRVVRKDDRTPIEGATVELRFRDADDFWNLDMEYGEQVETLASIQTDADGRFTFPAAHGRSYRLHVWAHGFAARTVPDCVASGSEIVIELGRGARLTGTVRCEGEVVPDVPVILAVAGESIYPGRTRTDAGGMFRFDARQPASVYVQVRSPEHSETWERVLLEDDGAHHVEIDLRPSRMVVGQVVDGSDGQPVAGARVATNWTFKRFVTTDAEGRFRIAYVADNEIAELHVRAGGFAEATRNVAPDDETEPVIELERGAAVTGRIVNGEGAALPGSYVAFGASFMLRPGIEHTDWIRAAVDDQGHFVARGLRSDQSYWLYARHRGRGTKVYALPARLAVEQWLDVGEVVLQLAGGVEGRVVDELGEPRAGVSVSLRGRNSDAGAWLDTDPPRRGVSQFESRSQRSAADGTFAFTEVAGGAYTVTARSRVNSNQTSQTEVTVSDGMVQAGLELVLANGASIEGRVRRANGLPLGELRESVRVVASHASSCAVDEAGHFRLQGLEPGQRHDLTLWDLPKGLAAAPARAIVAGATDVELVVESAATISGRVVDADGAGLSAGVHVTWEPPVAGGAPITRTGADGRFSIEVPPGFVGKVHASPTGASFPRAELSEVRAGANVLELVLR